MTERAEHIHLTETCDICNQGFDSPEELAEHRSKAHLIHECDVCGERFAAKIELTNHKKIHEASVPVTAKPYKCGSCNASFAERSQLEWHIKNKHNSKFTCCICGVWFDTMNNLDSHMRSKHNHYECPHCGHDTYFASGKELNKHIMDKHRSDER